MTLSVKNGGYALFKRLDLMFFISLWKEFQLLQILKNLSIRYLVKLNLYENDVKLLRSIYDMFEVWDFDYWYLKWNEHIKKSGEMVNLLLYSEFNVRMPII